VSSLTPESFSLDAEPPTVAVEAAYSKRRRRDVQPLPNWLVEPLRDWLAGKRAGEPVCRMTPGKGAPVLRADMAAARSRWIAASTSEAERQSRVLSPFLQTVDGQGRSTVGLHSLRVHFISRVAETSASLKQAMELARHSDPKLTMKTYAKVQMSALAAVVDGIAIPGGVPAEGYSPQSRPECGSGLSPRSSGRGNLGQRRSGRVRWKGGDPRSSVCRKPL
jgi:integrase/recombinase XerD